MEQLPPVGKTKLEKKLEKMAPVFSNLPNEVIQKIVSNITSPTDQLNLLAVDPRLRGFFNDKSVHKVKLPKLSTQELKAISFAKYQKKTYHFENFRVGRSPQANEKWVVAIGTQKGSKGQKICLVERSTGRGKVFPIEGNAQAIELKNNSVYVLNDKGQLTQILIDPEDFENSKTRTVQLKHVPNNPSKIQVFQNRVTILGENSELSTYLISDTGIKLENAFTFSCDHLSINGNLLVEATDGICRIYDLSGNNKIHEFELYKLPFPASKFDKKIRSCKLIGTKLCVEYVNKNRSEFKIFEIKDPNKEELLVRIKQKASFGTYSFIGNDEFIYHPRMKGYDLVEKKRVGRKPGDYEFTPHEDKAMDRLDESGKYLEHDGKSITITEFEPLKEDKPFLRAVGHVAATSAFAVSSLFFVPLFDTRYIKHHSHLAGHYFKVVKANYKKKKASSHL